MNFETTCRMPREELLGLLNTMTPVEQQRITAEMQAAIPPPDVVVRFREPRKLTSARLVVIGASFFVSLCVGFVIGML